MTPEDIIQVNEALSDKSPSEVVSWAITKADGGAVVSTNFRPYEAVILHLVTKEQSDIPILWVDHGYNRAATYAHAEELKSLLKLNIKAYLPKFTAAHYEALYGGIPKPVSYTHLTLPTILLV